MIWYSWIMKKLLGALIILSLFSTNSFSEVLNFSCKNSPDNGTHEFINISLDTKTKSVQIHYKWNEDYYNKYSGTRISSSTPMEKKYSALVKSFNNSYVVYASSSGKVISTFYYGGNLSIENSIRNGVSHRCIKVKTVEIAKKPNNEDLGNKKQVLEGIDKLSINYDYHFFAHSTSGEQFWGSTINRSQFLQLGYAKSTRGYECSLKSFQANSQAPYKGTWNLECPNFKADGSWTQESLSSNGIGKGFSDNGNVVSAYFSKNRQAIWGIANKFFEGQGSDIKIVEKPKKEKPKPKLDDDKIVPAGSGSGFFVLKDGTVITNYHVIESCEVNKVSYKGTQYNAKVLSVDKVNDIAILKTDIAPEKVFSVSNDDVSLLEDVVVAGYPLGKQISAAIKTHKGVVTALAGAGDNYSFFQTDAAINQGNSGGPIINQKGNVVGIAVATWVEEGVQGVHFGIKSSTLKTFASANGLSFIPPNNRDFSNKELGKLITEGTVYVECHMTLAKIKKMIAEMENKKAFFSEHKK